MLYSTDRINTGTCVYGRRMAALIAKTTQVCLHQSASQCVSVFSIQSDEGHTHSTTKAGSE